jgi:CDP-glucose 4,6-dehydratase
MGMNSFLSFFKGKRMLITGNTGFKGSWLSQMLLLAGANIVGYSLPPDSIPNMFNVVGLDKRMKTYFADIRNYDTFQNVLRKESPEILIHMAAQPLVRRSYDEPLYTYETNVVGTANVLQAMKSVGCVKSAVLITTDKVYENLCVKRSYTETDRLGGYDPYSASKACAELVIQSYIRSFFNTDKYGESHSTLVASARAGNVIGGGDWSEDRLIPDIIRSTMEKMEPVTIRNPDATRPWQHVMDPLTGYLLLAKGLHEGNKRFVGAWNFAPDEKDISVKEIVEKAIKIIGYGGYNIEADNTKHEMRYLHLSAEKAKKQLKWRPKFTNDSALEWTFEWYRQYYKKGEIEKITADQISRYASLSDKPENGG